MSRESDAIKQFLALAAPGFCVEGDLPELQLEGIEVRPDGHAVARVTADGRVLPIRFTFDGDRIARVEVL